MGLGKTYDPLRIGNSRIYVQDTEPAGAGSGDVWLDTSDRTEVGGTIELGDDEYGTFGTDDDMQLGYNSGDDSLELKLSDARGGDVLARFGAGGLLALHQNPGLQVSTGGNNTVYGNSTVTVNGGNAFDVETGTGSGTAARLTITGGSAEAQIDLNSNLFKDPKVEGSSTDPRADTTADDFMHVDIGGTLHYVPLFT